VDKLQLSTLVARFDHTFDPGQSNKAIKSLGEIFTLPSFDVFKRIFVERRGRWTQYKSISEKLIAEYLIETQNESVNFDSGRKSDLIAKARIEKGHNVVGSYLPTEFVSYIVIPLKNNALAELINSVCQIAGVLKIHAGAITVEKSFDKAESFALSIKEQTQTPLSFCNKEKRLRERAAYDYYRKDIDKKVSCPEWGLFLSKDHLKSLPFETLKNSLVFSKVRMVVPDQLVYIQMTNDPNDIFHPGFEEKYEKARQVLQPILMDTSDIPEALWK